MVLSDINRRSESEQGSFFLLQNFRNLYKGYYAEKGDDLMAKEVIEGLLVQEQVVNDGRKCEPKNIGVAFTEFEAQEMIERESEWYKDQPFEYGRSRTDKGIVYGNYHKNEKIYYTIKKCEVIKDVCLNISGV